MGEGRSRGGALDPKNPLPVGRPEPPPAEEMKKLRPKRAPARITLWPVRLG
jgi:hypothetical protein